MAKKKLSKERFQGMREIIKKNSSTRAIEEPMTERGQRSQAQLLASERTAEAFTAAKEAKAISVCDEIIWVAPAPKPEETEA